MYRSFCKTKESASPYKRYTVKRIGRFLFTIAFMTSPALAEQLSYMPVNPTFGGSSLNGTFLLNSAAANNNRYLTNPATKQAADTMAAAQSGITQNLQQVAISAVLSQVSQQITNDLKNGTSGSYTIGGQKINFTKSGGTMTINITDSTGATTTIEVPVPQY